jgi:putative AbiEii toxin of type IV toxin-antitoxin system
MRAASGRRFGGLWSREWSRSRFPTLCRRVLVGGQAPMPPGRETVPPSADDSETACSGRIASRSAGHFSSWTFVSVTQFRRRFYVEAQRSATIAVLPGVASASAYVNDLSHAVRCRASDGVLGGVMIKQLNLANFKAFERYTLSLSGDAILVGPNSAGKSTIIDALRLCARMIEYAHRRAPDSMYSDGGIRVWGYSLGQDQFDFVSENRPHEFQYNLETRIEVKLSDGGLLRVIWPGRDDPEESDAGAFFYLQNKHGMQPRRTANARAAFPSIGVIPLLSPIEKDEDLLDRNYVRRNWPALAWAAIRAARLTARPK